MERTCHWRKTMQRLVVSQVKSICEREGGELVMASRGGGEERRSTHAHAAHVVHAAIAVVHATVAHSAVIHAAMVHCVMSEVEELGRGARSV